VPRARQAPRSLTAANTAFVIPLGKVLMQDSWRADPAPGLKMEERLTRELIGSPNQVEAVKANVEKHAREFTNPEISVAGGCLDITAADPANGVKRAALTDDVIRDHDIGVTEGGTPALPGWRARHHA
jgi:hypothetical protein